MTNDLLTAIAIFVGLLITLELGFRAGARTRETKGVGQIGAIQGAMLGLLGLLLGFSFAGAASRFIERQDLIVQEANAIGTAYLRAQLLPEPHGAALRNEIKEYTTRRAEMSEDLALGVTPALLEEVAGQHDRIWRAARDGVNARPDMALAVLNPVNEVIDFHGTRLGASRKHLPLLVVVLLLSSSVLAVGVTGYGGGVAHERRAPLTVALVLVVAALLWVTIDLDHPRSGLLRLNDAPLKELKFEK